jgi:hypothetical protein
MMGQRLLVVSNGQEPSGFQVLGYGPLCQGTKDGPRKGGICRTTCRRPLEVVTFEGLPHRNR